MRTRRILVSLLVACALTAVPAARVLAEEPDLDASLPVDPAVHMIQLPNGLECWLREHGTPPDRLGVWMHVDSGSLNEADGQRGLAHFLEHMAFNGSEHFPPGELVKYFESIGLRFGQHQNAFTGFDQTVYTLALPDTKRDTIAKGMLCMSDYAFRLSLLPEEVEKEKGVVLEEVRARKGPGQRIIEKLLPIILPGSRVAERLPIGKEEVIEGLDTQKVRAYYEERYRPDNTTVLVVGDADPAMVEELIREHFAGWEPVERPAPEADPGVSPYEAVRAAVVTDPEAAETEVSVISVRALEQLKTVGDFRRNLVDSLGAWIVNRRFLEMLQKGEAPFQEAEVEKSPFLNTCTYIDATATGKPDAWREMLQSVLTELKRARTHGFLAQELDNARKAIAANAEQNARIEPTRDARAFLRRMNSALAQDKKPMSAGQKLKLIQQLIQTVSLEEVTAAFRRNFQPDARLLLV
ncbi:MAG: pitrilysin family protein, partial [Candidatus Brocadiaceae bacterium]